MTTRPEINDTVNLRHRKKINKSNKQVHNTYILRINIFTEKRRCKKHLRVLKEINYNAGLR